MIWKILRMEKRKRRPTKYRRKQTNNRIPIRLRDKPKGKYQQTKKNHKIKGEKRKKKKRKEKGRKKKK
jgi:hypothetical protein